MNEFPLNITTSQARNHKVAATGNTAVPADGTDFNTLLSQQRLDGATLEFPADGKHALPLKGKAAAHAKGSPATDAAGETQPVMLNALLAQPAQTPRVNNETRGAALADQASYNPLALSAQHPSGKKAAHNPAGLAHGKAGKTQDAQDKTVPVATDPAVEAAAAGLVAAGPLSHSDMASTTLPQQDHDASAIGKAPGKGKAAIQTASAHLPRQAGVPGKGADAAGHSASNTRLNNEPAGDSTPAAAARMPQELVATHNEEAAKTGRQPEHFKPAEALESAGLAPALMRGNEATPASPQMHNAGTATPAHTLHQPVGSPAWSGEFGQQITWIAKQKDHTAELHLNPPQLGPLDVVLKVSGDQASAQFSSPHAAVREAVEQAIPKLREMLADSGIMLGNATVSDQAPQRNQDQSPRNLQRRPDRVDTVSSATITHEAGNVQPRRHNGMVDTFV